MFLRSMVSLKTLCLCGYKKEIFCQICKSQVQTLIKRCALVNIRTLTKLHLNDSLQKGTESAFHLNWLDLFHFHILKRGLLVILIDYMVALQRFLDVRISMQKVFFFLAIARNFLPPICFPLTYGLNGFKSKVN